MIVKSIKWMYEFKGFYTHSYVLLETKSGLFYVVENNNLGVVWHFCDNFNDACFKKVDHNNLVSTRRAAKYKSLFRGVAEI